MELCKEFKSLHSSSERESFCEGFELDFQENLPQYLDDIEKIVKCSVKSVVTDYECTGGMIKLYGKSIISLTYFNSDGSILSNIFEEDFSQPINTKVSTDAEFAKIFLCTKYSSFRLINQRRIDVHTSIKAEISTFCDEIDKCLLNCKNAFVKEYSPQRLCERCAGICSENFDESFTISDSSNQIKNIINVFSNCVVEDKKIIKDKMLVKLKLEASILYETEENSVEKSVHGFSLSKIIDAADAGEDDSAFVNAAVSSLYVKAKADGSNKLRDIEVAGRVTINYCLYYLSKDEFIVDSYMTKYNTELEKKSLSVKSSPVYYFDDKSAEIALTADKNIIDILDLNVSLEECALVSSELVLSVRLSFLYYDDMSTLCYYENTAEYRLQLCDEKLPGSACVNIISYDYVIKNADTVHLRINFEYCAYLFSREEIGIITDISTSSEKEVSDMPQLTLYFAEKDENVWDIAKKFSTAMSLITEENDLTSQVIDGQRILLVPGM